MIELQVILENEEEGAVWLSKYINGDIPHFVKDGSKITLDWHGNSSMFTVKIYDWYLPNNIVSIGLTPCGETKGIAEMAKEFLYAGWELNDGNTSYNMMYILTGDENWRIRNES